MSWVDSKYPVAFGKSKRATHCKAWMKAKRCHGDWNNSDCLETTLYIAMATADGWWWLEEGGWGELLRGETKHCSACNSPLPASRLPVPVTRLVRAAGLLDTGSGQRHGNQTRPLAPARMQLIGQPQERRSLSHQRFIRRPEGMK
ncbi:hypothetical protein SKAU_G00291510 [Synaphobranchus kaupii]|uniref:Uncharacterized protein n=1 Tax=Synaphobranchus kaupii TaxID=118154 RepID=A0A9Q1ETX3_SYNKA|nr:hypothetical protein SKAU_G00291510 [Synaphobranchus kaupii]